MSDSSYYRETPTEEVCRNCFNNETGRSMCPICRGVGFITERMVLERIEPDIDAAIETRLWEHDNLEAARHAVETIVDAALSGGMLVKGPE